MSWAGSTAVQVPFRRLFTPIGRPVPENAGIVTAYTDGQVTLRSNRDKIGYHEAADLSHYQGVLPGDFVVHGLDILRGSVGVSDSAGAISSVCTICRPISDVDPRFMAYVMRIQAASGLTRAMARGVREGGADFRRWDTLAELPLPLVPLAEQRRVADFLDDRIARIAQIITARRQQIARLDEQRRNLADELLGGSSAPLVRLGHFLRGIEQGWSPQCDAVAADSMEWGVLKVGAVQPGWFNPLENKRLPDNEQPMPEYEIQAGDLLVSRANTPERVGFFTVVPNDVRPRLILCDKIMRISVDAVLEPAFVALVGQSRRTRDRLTLAGTGTSSSMVNIRGDDIRSIAVPLVSVTEQRELVSAWRRDSEQIAWSRSSLAGSMALLDEYKQSLITAAVTGELDVATAGSGVPG